MAGITINNPCQKKGNITISSSKMNKVGSHHTWARPRRKKRVTSDLFEIQKKASKIKLPATGHVFLFLVCCWLVSVWLGLVGGCMCILYLCLSIMTWPCTSLSFAWSQSFQLSLGHMVFSTLLFVFVSKFTNDTNTFLSPKVIDWV